MDEEQQPSRSGSAGETETLLVAQFTTIREEIVKRIEWLGNVPVVLFALLGAVAGAYVWAAGDTSKEQTSFIVAMLVALGALLQGWAVEHNHVMMAKLSAYIRIYIEPHFVGKKLLIGWESYGVGCTPCHPFMLRALVTTGDKHGL